ncbi:MAG: AzlD domain-containing protein [Oscillospiraceae bacterium]|nr:AzlD domain-containing protein [Oscillospiraceae bacterium]
MSYKTFFIYLLIMAGITYLIRMVPLVLIKKRIKNRFLLSFLHYIPYTVLSVMTIPAIFYSTSSIVSAVFGFVAAIFLAYKEKSLLKLAAISCVVVFVVEFVLSNI